MKCRRGRGNRKRGQVRGWTAAPVGGGGGKGEKIKMRRRMMMMMMMKPNMCN
jgi:hypothetical protein